MIIIDNQAVLADIVIMKSMTGHDTASYTFKLKSRYSGLKFVYEVFDIHDDPMHWRFSCDLSLVPDDEYEYELLSSDNESLSTGLMKIGLEKSKRNVSYNADNEYVFYDGKTNG